MTTSTIVATVSPELAEIVTDRMWQWGVQAVSETTLGDGRIEIATSVGNDLGAVERALATLDAAWPVEVRDVDDSIAHHASEYLSTTWNADGMVSVPAALMPYEPAGHAVMTVIDPGSAFGLGDHPTTRTAMALLAGLIRDESVPAVSVLDVGCGTGALAVLAAQLGVGEIRAIDIADAAVEATRRNMELNDVAGTIDVDTTPVGALSGSYDIVVANILAPVLIAMADDLRRLLRPGGSLIISGILTERHDHVLAAFAPLGVSESLDHDGWISIVLR